MATMTDERYRRNLGSITEAEQRALSQARVLVAGCGGIGGFVAELLARLGVGVLRIVDDDAFDPTNLNRQLFATRTSIGAGKAACAATRLAEIDPGIAIEAIDRRLDAESAPTLVEDAACAIDALDSLEARAQLARACETAGIPLVHGAVSGWAGRVCCIAPLDGAAGFLFGDDGKMRPPDEGDPAATVRPADPHRLDSAYEQALRDAGTLGPACACAASIMAAEAVKILLAREGALFGQLLSFNLLSGTFGTFLLPAPRKAPT